MNHDGQSEGDWAKTQRDIARRQRTIAMPKTASRWVNQIVARWGIAESQSADELETAWREVAGESLAGRTRVGAVRRGVWEITVETSALLQQITFQQRALLQQLQDKKPHFAIRQLRFRVGPVR
jgi:predicted nucleic acid-binding Zn ribbon protein